MYATISKEKPDPVVGLAELTRFRKLTDKPLVAIGGITIEMPATSWQPAPIPWRSFPGFCPIHRICGF